jgi:hypothetical protein
MIVPENTRGGQSTTMYIVIGVVILILAIIVVPRVLRRFNFTLPRLPLPRPSAVDPQGLTPTNNPITPASPAGRQSPNNPITGNVLPAQATPTGGSLPTTHNPQPTTIPSPLAGQFIQGKIAIENHSDREIETVEVVYCDNATVPKDEKHCIAAELKNVEGDANSVWFMYRSTPHNFYHYQLNVDSRGNPMEVGTSYTIQQARAKVDGFYYTSTGRWVDVRYPGTKNFSIALPTQNQ